MIALDIGTRTLAAAEVENGVVRRLAVREHAGTPMRGGQVQDLRAVAAGVRALREELDLPEGTPASMAIAGGLLRTESLDVLVAGPGPWTEQDLRAAELDAVAQARANRRASGPEGHDLLMDIARGHMARDGEPVGSLVGMSGTTGSWTALTSWLPLEQVRLKMEAVAEGGFFPRTITVEPLAVSAALFGSMPPPSTYAVVDIGAGTSDIAVFSPAGLLEAASVPLAGDTITTAIATALALDHIAADHLKRDPGTPVRDLWGDEKRFRAAGILEAAEPGVTALVSAISERIRALSPALPSGIILVGGGSLWADLPERLATALGLPADRVRRRGAETVPGIKDETGRVRGPAFLTLLGIILTESSSFSRRRFRRDGTAHWTLARGRAFESEARTVLDFTVADALVSLGDDPLRWFGEPEPAAITGDAVTGGSPGEPPRVLVNGRPATLDTVLADDDDFSIEKGSAGARTFDVLPVADRRPVPDALPVANALSVADASSSAVSGAGSHTPAVPLVVTLDGEEVKLDDLVVPADDAAVLSALKERAGSRGFVTLNGDRLYVGERRQVLKLDHGVYVSRELDPPLVGALVPLPVPRALELVLNGTPSVVRDATRTAVVNGVRTPASRPAAWESSISTERGPWRLYEILAAHSGTAATPHLNGQVAPWTAEVRAGDRVDFR